MAVLLPDSCPRSATYTFADDNQNQLSLVGNLPMRYTNTIIITNLSTTNNIYISPKDWATAITEEYTLLPWCTLEIDWREDAQFDPFIRGTAWSKVSYFIG